MILKIVKTSISVTVDKIAITRSARTNIPSRVAHKGCSAAVPPNIITDSFAVSSITRKIIVSDDRLRHIYGKMISTLLKYIGSVLKTDSMNNRVYSPGNVPGYHMLDVEDRNDQVDRA
ncbi:unnamed protein product [Phytomonas sp. Hart1]|nr:unnamed protein product [Phytomonas sp. Hart1]|eukprot:CCW68394.1 unnamed protein product [Phytomonas sp. isolate Hart1]